MALKGDAKAVWQRAYMRAYRKSKRKDADMARLKWDKARAAKQSEDAFTPRGQEHARPFRKSVNTDNADLGVITEDDEGYDKLAELARRKGYKSGWAAHQFKRRFGHFPWEP